MPTIPFWIDSPAAWDQVIVAGVALPGRSRAKAKAGRKIDVRNVRGRDGARTRDGGYTPAQITIEVEVWEDDQLQALLPRLEQLQPRRGSTARQPLQVAHPSLAAIGISQVYVESISAPELSSGILKTTITCVEWTEAPPASRANTTTTTPASNEGGPTAFENHENQVRSRNRPPAGPPAPVVASTARPQP